MSRKKEREYEAWRVLGFKSNLGRTQDHVQGDCGYTKWVFRWSWAGNGVTQCPSCGKYWQYSRSFTSQ